MDTSWLRRPFSALISPLRARPSWVAPTRCKGMGSGTKRCSALKGGAQAGLILATMITYIMYRPASMMPGKNAPAYSCTTETPAVAP